MVIRDEMIYLFCVLSHCRDGIHAAGDLAFYLARSVGASMTFCFLSHYNTTDLFYPKGREAAFGRDATPKREKYEVKHKTKDNLKNEGTSVSRGGVLPAPNQLQPILINARGDMLLRAGVAMFLGRG